MTTIINTPSDKMWDANGINIKGIDNVSEIFDDMFVEATYTKDDISIPATSAGSVSWTITPPSDKYFIIGATTITCSNASSSGSGASYCVLNEYRIVRTNNTLLI